MELEDHIHHDPLDKGSKVNAIPTEEEPKDKPAEKEKLKDSHRNKYSSQFLPQEDSPHCNCTTTIDVPLKQQTMNYIPKQFLPVASIDEGMNKTQLTPKAITSTVIPLQSSNQLLNLNDEEGKDANKKQIAILINDIKNKEAIIKTLASTNASLRQNLLIFSEKVESLCQQKVKKVSTLSSKQLETKQEVKNLESNLQLKEKELKNLISLIDTYSKENKSLKKKLEAYGEYDFKFKLDNQLKAKEIENEQLAKDNKRLNKLLVDHNNCSKAMDQFESTIASLRKEVLNEKHKAAELKAHNRALESKFNNMTSTVCNVVDSEVKLNSSAHLASLKLKPIEKKDKAVIHLSKEPSLKDMMNSTKLMELFDEEEKEMLTVLFQDKAEKRKVFMRKVHIIESYRTFNDSRQRSQLRKSQEEIEEKKEQIDYLNDNCIKAESRLKILTFQLNDVKNSNKAYQRKVIVLQQTVDALNGKVKEKEKERLYAVEQMQILQKLFSDIHKEEKELKIKSGNVVSIPTE